MKQKNSLKHHIWFYLVIFTFIIITVLWFFQVGFIKKYYEYNKIKQIKNTTIDIIENYNEDIKNLDKISYEENVCIEIVKNEITIYSSNSSSRGCTNNNDYKKDFLKNNYKEKSYKIINPTYKNKSLIYAKKYNDNISIFVNASLQPLNNMIIFISNQLLLVTLIVIIIALIIGNIISKKIGRPIENINNNALKLANGDFNFNFNNYKIKEINELSATLNYAKNELKQTDTLRRELLANVSHDLKTPLTMIKGYAEMIRDLNGSNEEKRNENLNVIIEESERLNLLVNDLLTLSKIQANKDEITKEKFDIVELINNIINRYKIYKDLEGYQFILNVPNKVIINADKKKIEQVIYNLINNAINYTGKDKKIFISVKLNDNVRIEIKDTGKGIKEEDKPYIWNKYYHSNKKHKRNVIGTGIGLSIVKTVLESHNCLYGFTSELNKGTTFYFELEKEVD